MEIFFATEVLKDVCLARSTDSSQLSTGQVQTVHAFYNALRTAESVEELPYWQPVDKTDPAWSVKLNENVQVTLEANHRKLPKLGPLLDWSKVYRLKITSIEALDV